VKPKDERPAGKARRPKSHATKQGMKKIAPSVAERKIAPAFFPEHGVELVPTGPHQAELRPTYVVTGFDPVADTARELASYLEHIADKLERHDLSDDDRKRLRLKVAAIQRAAHPTKEVEDIERRRNDRRARLFKILSKWSAMNGTIEQRSAACRIAIVRELSEAVDVVDENVVREALRNWGRRGPKWPAVNALFNAFGNGLGYENPENLRDWFNTHNP
jgi:hypothetical protein